MLASYHITVSQPRLYLGTKYWEDYMDLGEVKEEGADKLHNLYSLGN